MDYAARQGGNGLDYEGLSAMGRCEKKQWFMLLGKGENGLDYEVLSAIGRCEQKQWIMPLGKGKTVWIMKFCIFIMFSIGIMIFKLRSW